MRLITKQKQVNFHGIMVWVPETAKSVASDKNGDVWYYEKQNPVPSIAYEAWGKGGYCQQICTVDLEGMKWRDTLVEVE